MRVGSDTSIKLSPGATWDESVCAMQIVHTHSHKKIVNVYTMYEWYWIMMCNAMGQKNTMISRA